MICSLVWNISICLCLHSEHFVLLSWLRWLTCTSTYFCFLCWVKDVLVMLYLKAIFIRLSLHDCNYDMTHAGDFMHAYWLIRNAFFLLKAPDVTLIKHEAIWIRTLNGCKQKLAAVAPSLNSSDWCTALELTVMSTASYKCWNELDLEKNLTQRQNNTALMCAAFL